MWMDQMIVSKYYEFGDLDTESKFNIYKNFIKGLIGTKTFAYCTYTSEYIKVADNAEYTENVLVIRASDLKISGTWDVSYGESQNCRFTSDGYKIQIKPRGLNAQSYGYIEYGDLDFAEASKVMYKARNPEYGNTDLTLKLIELFYNYILPKYGDTYVWLIEDDGNYEKEFKSLLNSITAFVNSTSIKYSKLIDVYNSNKDKLMDKLQSVTSQSSSSSSSNTNVNLQNDVPGTENLTEYSFDESHTSMAYKDTNSGSSSGSSSINYSTDTLYIMDKLQNVKDKLVDIYNVWSDEFHKILMGYKPY